MSEKPRAMELTIKMDEDSIVGIEASDGADLFSLIVMAETAHQMLMGQYLTMSAAKAQQRSQFKPKLLIPTQG